MSHLPTSPSRLLPLVALALAALGLLPAVARANDSSFGGRGAELIPLKETRIKMVSEDIVIEERGGRWVIQATYQFENPTAEVVKLQMGFPEEECHPDADCADSDHGRFHDMKTTARGAEVPHRVGEVAPETEWAPSLGRVFLYDLTFQPHERVTVVHQYNTGQSTSVDGREVSYITRTGGLWNGPIGSARFTIRTLQRPWAMRWPATFKLESYVERPTGPGKGVTEIVFAMKSWTPKEDLDLLLANPWFSPRCPGHPFLGNGMSDAELRQTLREADDSELSGCHNLPYAHHGYTFKDKDLQERFYPAEGASLVGEDSPNAAVEFMPNPAYSPDLLTLKEHRYVAIVKEEVKRRKKAAPR